jgi:hypothetical protein
MPGAYHYAVGKDGKKHRVYNKPVRGKGAYYQGRSVSRSYAAYARRGPMKGRGGYYNSRPVKFLNKYVPKNTFSSVGASVAGPLGAAMGSGLSKLLGFGAYRVDKNSMISEGESPARMHSNSSSLRVRHREYITDIISAVGANAFLNQTFSINPGLAINFPWLSAIAAQYQEYKPLGIVYEFKSLSADAIASGTNTTLGYVILATDYNSINAPFPNKQAMDNAEYTTSCKPSENVYHPIECNMKANPLNILYVRNGAAPAGTDLRMYDLGQFQIATGGVQGSSVVLGELWVTYEFEFSKPISTSALGQDVLSDHFQLGTVGNSSVLGTTSVLEPNSSIGGAINTSGTVYSFNPLVQEGTFLIVYNVVGTSTACTSPAITFTNCKYVKMWNADAANSIGSSGTTCTNLTVCFVVQVTGMNASVNFGSGILPVPVTSGDFFVTQWDSQVVL